MITLAEIKNKYVQFNHHIRLNISDESLGLDELRDLLKCYAKDLIEIRSLDIDLSSIEAIPDEIFLIEGLEKISFQGKHFKGLKHLSLPEKITSFTLCCDTIDELPGFLYTKACKHVSIRCRSVTNLTQDTIQLLESTAMLTLSIDELPVLPPIKFGSIPFLCEIRSKTLRKIDFSFCQHSAIDRLIVDCETLESTHNIEAINHVRQFECYTKQALDLSKWSIPKQTENLRLSASHLTLPNFMRATMLHTLHIKGMEGEIEHNIGCCGNLEELKIDHSKIQSITPDIKKCLKLKNMSIHNSLDFFPGIISQLAQLRRLTFRNNTFSIMNIDWSGLKNLTALTLEDNQTVFTSLAFISNLPELSMLNINGNTLESRYVLLHKKKIPIERCSSILTSTKVSNEALLAFCAALAKTRLKEQDKKDLLDLVWEQGLQTDLFLHDSRLLTAALNVNYRALKTRLIDHVRTFVKDHHGLKSLDKHSVLYLEGKPNTTLTKFRATVAAIGYKLSKCLDETVTHIIIGKSPTNPNIFDSDRFVYLTENDVFSLDAQQNPKFLTQQVEQSQTSAMDSINDLLFNSEPVNVAIGLKMLDTGGVPEGVLEAVLMIAKSNPDAKVRKQAKKILIEQGPAEWTGLLEDKQLFKNLNGYVKEQDINNKMIKIERTAGLDAAAILSIALYRRYKKGLRFLIEQKELDNRWLQRMYALLMEGEHFEFATGLGYKNWKNTHPDDMILFKRRKSYSFPKAVLQWHKVTSINLHNTKLSTLPKELALFKDLKKIDLSANSLASIAPHIVELTEVESLDLRFNDFKRFPSHLEKLPKLKKVDLRHCFSDNQLKTLEIPSTIKKLMPNCEILV